MARSNELKTTSLYRGFSHGALSTAASTMLLLALAGTASALDTQRVSPTPETQTKGASAAVEIDVGYTTSTVDATLTGLGLRVHFDSTKLTYAAPSNILATGLLGQQDPQADTSNFDGDPSTDRFLLVSWADVAGNWPGSVPIRLLTLHFTTTADFSGQTTVRFSAASTAAGYSFASTPAVITASSTGGPTLAEAGAHRAVVPGAAHAPGLLGTSWVSDVVLHNPGTVSTTANLYFLPANKDNSAVRGITRTVPAGQSLRLDDIVASTFGLSTGNGAILVGSGEPLMVSSRTFNNAPDGTYGQYLQGFPSSEAITGTTVMRLVQLTRNATYRTNIGFANASGTSLPVTVQLYRADGSAIGSRSFTVPPWGQLQDTDIIGKLTSADVNDAYALVSSTSATASYFVYASVADNRSGDPVTVVPVPASAPSGAGATAPALRAASTGVTLMSDDFEGSFPGVWRVVRGSSATDAAWGRSTYRAVSGTASAWCAASGTAAGPAGGPYRSTMNTWMTYGPFSLADATAATLEFDLWLESEQDYDLVRWMISLDDETYSGYRYAGDTGGWVHVVFDFAEVTAIQAIGAAQVWAGFNFETDSSLEYEGAYIDNVVLRKWTNACTAPSAPAMSAPATAASGAAYAVSWNATSADGTYDLEEATDPSFTGATSLQVTGTSASFSHSVGTATTYSYRVRARQACGGSTYTSPWSATAQTVVSPAASGEAIFVPGGAALPGVGGTNWRTDLEVHNPATARAELVVALLRRDQQNSTPETRSYSLEGGRSVRYDNAMQAMFGASGAATLRITPSTGGVMVTSRTYNDLPEGTYGQFVAGVPAGRAIAYGGSARLIHLSRSADTGSGFRSNVGLVNTTDGQIVVEVSFYSGAGVLLGTRTYTLRAFESIQRTDVLAELGTSDVSDAYAVLRTTTSGGRFLAYASVVDNRSGDPIYIPAR